MGETPGIRQPESTAGLVFRAPLCVPGPRLQYISTQSVEICESGDILTAIIQYVKLGKR